MIKIFFVILEFLLNFLFPIILIGIGIYFKRNVQLIIGKSGYITKKSTETFETWIYAQVIAPQIILKLGKICAVLVLITAVVMVKLGFESKAIFYACNIIGFIFVFIPFFCVDEKLEEFQKNKLFHKENEKEKWVRLVQILIAQKQLPEIDKITYDEKVREYMFEKYNIN